MPRICALACLIAAAAATLPVGASGIVANGEFDAGGRTYADHWRPLPGSFRMHRRSDSTGEHSLYLQLRADGDGGVVQVVDLPPGRRLSLRVLATCWANGNDAVVAGLIRRGDGLVLAEIVVDGIERGEMAADFETGPGGPAELMLRLVGDKGARASIERVTIGPPIEARVVGRPAFGTSRDLVLGPGDGLRIDADFAPRLLPAAAEMLQEALEDITGQATERTAATVSVSVPQPESTEWPARESYHLTVRDSGVTIEAPAEQGAFWAMMTLIDLMRAEPAGGARILAVDVADEPALPWRIGSHHALEDRAHSENAARSLARLKLNMVLVGYDWSDPPERDTGAVAALRTVGLEPIIGIATDCPVRPEAALADARARLDASHFLVEPWWDRDPVRGQLDWGEPGLRAALDAAEEITAIVPAYTYLGHHDNGGGEFEALAPGELDDWPGEVIACLLPETHSGAAGEEVVAAEAKGVRYIIVDDRELEGTAAAVRARQRTTSCLGVVITQWGELQEQAANTAWRGPADRDA